MKYIKKIFVLLATGLLASSIALAGGKSSQLGTDAWITAQVKTSIYSEKLFGKTNPPSVGVTTTNGNVVLTGSVRTQEQKDLVINFVKAQNIKGVNNVNGDQLVVNPNG